MLVWTRGFFCLLWLRYTGISKYISEGWKFLLEIEIYDIETIKRIWNQINDTAKRWKKNIRVKSRKENEISFETISECKWLSTTWIHTRIEKWWINPWHLKYSRNPLDAHKSSTVFSNTFCYFAFDYLRCSRFFARISISHDTFFAVVGGSVHLFVITISFIIWADAATAAAVAAAWCLLCVDFGYLRSTCQYNAHVIKNIISSILICALFEAWFFESAILSHTHTITKPPL